MKKMASYIKKMFLVILITFAILCCLELMLFLDARYQILPPFNLALVPPHSYIPHTNPLDSKLLKDAEKIVDGFGLKGPKKTTYSMYKDGRPVYENSFKSDKNLWAGWGQDTPMLNRNVVGKIELYSSITRKPLYKANYSTDSLGRRSTKNQPLKSQSDIVLLGCSNLFGDGINDEDTVASQLQSLEKNRRVLNLGLPGADPGTFVQILNQEGYPPFQDIRPHAHFYFLHIDDHLRRVMGTFSWGLADLEHFNRFRFTLNDSGALIQRGQKKDRYGDFFPLVKYLLSTHLVSFMILKLNIDFPRIDHEDFVLHSKLIFEMKNLIQKKFPGSKFSFVVSPGNDWYGSSLVPILEGMGVDVVNLGPIKMDKFLHGHEYLDDYHPSRYANILFAYFFYQAQQGKF